MLPYLVIFILGGIFVILVELFMLYKWFQNQPNVEIKKLPNYKPVTNPEDVAKFCEIDGATQKESCMFLNLIFQFLWREWRDSPKTRNFFIKKMNLEFQEMLLNKTAGKLMEQITVRDYYLGDSLPVFKSATIMKIDSKNYSQIPREIDIAVDLEYSGGFIISLDVDLIFGKTASLFIKLNKLIGRVRLQYTRNPCTHWSFSFYEDPVMDIEVDSNFEGRNLPKLTSFIHNQIRKSIKKKHTLPRYKVRYKPFFAQGQPQDGKKEVFIHNNLVTVGKMDLEIVECTRIPKLPKGSHVYCSISLDTLPWKEDMPMKRSLWPVHEVLMSKMKSGSLGVSFGAVKDRNYDDHEIITVETIFPNSPATQVDIQKGDILISVNNVDITNMKQARRLIRKTDDQFTFKLQRPPPMTQEIGQQHIPFDEKDAVGGIDRLNSDVQAIETKEIDLNQHQRDFDYNSYVIQDDDSETEEFVNIVVNELASEITNDEAEKLMQEVNTIKRSSLVPSTMPEGSDFVDRCVLPPNNDNSLTESLVSQQENNTPKKRGFSFFKRNKNSTPQDKGGMRRRTSDTSLFVPQRKENVLERSLNFEPCASSSGKHETRNEDAVTEPEHVDIQDEEVSNTSSNNVIASRKVSEVNREWDNISTYHLDTASLEAQPMEEEKEPTGQRTSPQNANKDLVWNEMFSFEVEKEHRFLNICVWCKHEESFEKDVLLGYVSVPLMELAVECLSTSSRKSIRKFNLKATSSRSTISRTYLRTVMPGLDPNCCHGDITLAYRYFISTQENNLEKESKAQETKEMVERENNCTHYHDADERKQKTHNFIGQEFYFPTRCDYCQNKIWRKVAFQCLVCGMISHKRCIQNVQTNTYCTSKGVRAKPPKWQLHQSNSTVFGNNEHKKVKEQPSSEQNTSNENRVPPPLAVPDEDDLRPGIKNVSQSSPNVLRRRNNRSQHEKHKRTVSLQEMLQDDKSCQNIPEDVEDGDLNDSIATAAVTAKEAGRELFASLDKENREENIRSKVSRLQREITTEKEQQMELRIAFDECTDIESKQKYTLLIRKSEERSQALALLMIQYCAALNECLSIGEPQQVHL